MQNIKDKRRKTALNAMDIINARKVSDKQVPVEKPPVKVENRETQVVPKDF